LFHYILSHSTLDLLLGINNAHGRMDKIGPNEPGRRRRLTGILALGLLVLANFQPALINTALWLVEAHGHDHHVMVRADGNHLDVMLSHPADHEPAAHHESSLGLLAAFFSTHDHEGDVHVLHFYHSDVLDQMRARAGICQALTPQGSWLATDLTTVIASLPSSFPAVAARPPPALAAGLLCLRTTVLLI
jgi:hypothetical protein